MGRDEISAPGGSQGATPPLPRWKPYPKYKESGVEWLGEIPEGWNLRRLKHIAPVSSEKLSEKPLGMDYVGLENIESKTGRLLMDMPAENVDSNVSVFKSGDILFGKLRPYLAKVVHLTWDGVCTTELLVLKPNEFSDGHFLFYQLLSDGFIRLVDSMTYGTKMPRASGEQVGNIVVPQPELSEQHAIAAFLDRETARIDALLEKKRRLIELLEEKRAAVISHAVTKGLDPNAPMKDSGVEWLGEIPAGWESKRLKFVANVLSGVAKGRELHGKQIVELPYLRVANVQEGYVDLTNVETIELEANEIERFSLKPGDVLMNEGGDYDKLGRGTVWDGAIDPCVHQNHVFSVRPCSSANSNWISMITQTSYAKHYFILKSKQSTNLASISSTNIKELPLILPKANEMIQILRFIENETAKIDALLSKIEEAIAKLQEYRTALISAAVTGKIDVREAYA